MPAINVRVTCYTDPTDPTGPALFRLEIWPMPQKEGLELTRECDALVKNKLREMGWTGKEEDLTGQGPMQ